MGLSHWALLAGTLALAGCGGGREDGEQSRRDTGGMMGGMDSGGMGVQGMPMMPGMRAHMDSMMRMSPQRMQAMMAMHQRKMSQMMDGMGADMRGMNTTSDTAWAALSDSVRRDLADLPGLSGAALEQRMSGHVERVKRLLDRHEAMMQGMRSK